MTKIFNSSFWVLGTDTEVGKTYVTSLLALYYQMKERPFALCKPVAAGTIEVMGDIHNEDVEALKSIVVGTQSSDEICPWLLSEPMGPWSASKIDGIPLSVDPIVKHLRQLEEKHSLVIAEGAGGISVPLNENETYLDAVEKSSWPVVLVVGMKLGCINHTLLTLEALKNRKIDVKAVVLNQCHPGVPEAVLQSSKEEISSRFNEIIELSHLSSYPMALSQLEKYSDILSF